MMLVVQHHGQPCRGWSQKPSASIAFTVDLRSDRASGPIEVSVRLGFFALSRHRFEEAPDIGGHRCPAILSQIEHVAARVGAELEPLARRG